MFNIINLKSGELVLDFDGKPLVFESGQEAASWAFSRTSNSDDGSKYQPRKIANRDSHWREREESRFALGHYVRPEWYYNDNGFVPLPDHFLHVSKVNPSVLAYTKDSDKGECDVQTRISVVAYLTQFHGLDEDSARAYHKIHVGKYAAQGMVKFAKSADEIESIYTRAHYDKNRGAGDTRSCMTHSASSYKSFIHPVRVYGDSDLQLAYLENDDEEIIARCLVWSERFLYGRCYGASDTIARLLQAAGYTRGDFEGARIRRIEDKKKRGRYVLPYLDGIQSVYDDCEGFFVISEDDCEYVASHTTGLSESGYICERCEDEVDEDYLSNVDSGGYDRSWCNHCCDNHAIVFEGSLFDSEDCIFVDGEHVPQDIAERRGVSYCDYSNEYTFESVVDVYKVRLVGGWDVQSWAKSAVEDFAFKCRVSNRFYPDAYIVRDPWVDDDLLRCRYVLPDDVPHGFNGVFEYTDPDHGSLFDKVA
jgi:hypothetical protein